MYNFENASAANLTSLVKGILELLKISVDFCMYRKQGLPTGIVSHRMWGGGGGGPKSLTRLHTYVQTDTIVTR